MCSLLLTQTTRTPTAIVISSDYISARVRLLSRSSTLHVLWIFKMLEYLYLKYLFEGYWMLVKYFLKVFWMLVVLAHAELDGQVLVCGC